MKRENKQAGKGNNKIYDIIIIGAGPAGLTAALYSARNGLNVGVVSKDIGGTVNSVLRIENWPGFSGSGPELMKKFYEQVKEYSVDFILEEAVSIENKSYKIKDKGFLVKTKRQELKCKSLIFSTGSQRKKLKINGEEKFLGRGVSYCATCDAFFFKNKDVAVIIDSDCNSSSALVLSDVARKVYLIYRGEKLRCDGLDAKKLNEKKNVQAYYSCIPLEVVGKDKVEGLKISCKSKKEVIQVDGIFIEEDFKPISELSKNLGLKINNEKFIEVDEDMKTSIEGIYAAGDITHTKLKQVVVAASQGATAAKSAYEWLSKKRSS